MIELRLFGICDIRIDGQPLPPMRYRKDLWVLALLALHPGRECPRDWLAVTLWPDADERLALVSMRQGSASHFFAFDPFAFDPSQNARALTDPTGAVTDTYVYTAFGEEKS